MDPITFTTTLEGRPKGGVLVPLPFDPATAWGSRRRYHVAGTIEANPMRGEVTFVEQRPVIALGPSWCRDPRMGAGARVSVRIVPEGPQLDTIPTELADALAADPEARASFEALASFYRKGFVRPIETATRSETRLRRARAVVDALHAGRNRY